MNLIDYTGKLNEHSDYVEMLERVRKYCKYIEIVIDDKKVPNELVKMFENDIILKKEVSEWWAIKTSSLHDLYRFKYTREFFQKLKQYETFCKYHESINEGVKLVSGSYLEKTDFGYDDIAFYDEDNNLLLFTTTHEGYITVDSKLVM